MLFYRTIDFSRLIFLIDNSFKEVFENTVLDFQKENSNGNFWFDSSYDDIKYDIINNVIKNQRDFFSKSLDFNSRVGGRFNPSRSFGSLYLSDSPTLATLECLYHTFEGSKKVFHTLMKSSDKLNNAFNIQIPNFIENLFVAFEVEVDDSFSSNDICNSRSLLMDLCVNLGFSRYIDEGKFDENFIFGNDYEISNIIGCYYHNNVDSIIKYPSARIPLNSDSFREISNYSVPEKDFRRYDFRLTGRIREYRSKVYLEENSYGYNVELEAKGLSIKTVDFYLQPWPLKRNKNQIKSYHPVLSGRPHDGLEKYSREVRIQKFFLRGSNR